MRRLAGLLLLASSCSPIRYSVAPMAELRLPALSLEGIRGRLIRLEVQDQRSEPELTVELVAATQNTFDRILRESGADPSSGTDKLTVRILTYRADFQLAEWTGCTEFLALLSLDGRTIAAPGEKCITHQNMGGYRTADDVLKSSYQDAIVDVVNKLQLELLAVAPVAGPRSPEPASTPPILPAP